MVYLEGRPGDLGGCGRSRFGAFVAKGPFAVSFAKHVCAGADNRHSQQSQQCNRTLTVFFRRGVSAYHSFGFKKSTDRWQ